MGIEREIVTGMAMEMAKGSGMENQKGMVMEGAEEKDSEMVKVSEMETEMDNYEL
jgi:hypothetical protein